MAKTPRLHIVQDSPRTCSVHAFNASMFKFFRSMCQASIHLLSFSVSFSVGDRPSELRIARNDVVPGAIEPAHKENEGAKPPEFIRQRVLERTWSADPNMSRCDKREDRNTTKRSWNRAIQVQTNGIRSEDHEHLGLGPWAYSVCIDGPKRFLQDVFHAAFTYRNDGQKPAVSPPMAL